MKFRQVVRGGRATLAAAAGTVMVVGGAGAGTAALALSHSAGALSLQTPAIAVREQNVNSAGRIRVALPSGGVGVNGTVAVSNFPKTQPVSGTVNVGNRPTTAASEFATATMSNGGTMTVLGPPPTGEAYHIGLVTVDIGCNTAYPAGASLGTPGGTQIANMIIAPQGTSTLPFNGAVLPAGQGMDFSSNASNGSCTTVVVNYWLGPVS